MPRITTFVEAREAPESDRALEVSVRFGLRSERGRVKIVDGVSVESGPGRLVLVSGPSGVGKSSLLREFCRRVEGCRSVEAVRFRADESVIDQVLPGGSLPDAIRLLTGCGMGEPRLWLRRFGELSDGERLRARLARAVGLQVECHPGGPLVCDEFASVLDRRSAKALAYSVRRQVSRLGLSVVVATAREDILSDLQPDQLIRLRKGCAHHSEERTPVNRRMSLVRRFRIERGRMSDYRAFSRMHYRSRDELGFADRVFVMRERAGDEPVAIVVYAHAPLELSLRNVATAGRFSRNPQRLNRELRILRRLVVVPELRGCGLGRILVEKTLPMLGLPYVECLANLGDMNLVLERAGMTRIGSCPIPDEFTRLDRELREMGVDPLSAEFPSQVARRPKVRRLVKHGVYRWYCKITHAETARERVARQGAGRLAIAYRQLVGSRPVYYLWQRTRPVAGRKSA